MCWVFCWRLLLGSCSKHLSTAVYFFSSNELSRGKQEAARNPDSFQPPAAPHCYGPHPHSSKNSCSTIQAELPRHGKGGKGEDKASASWVYVQSV